MGFSNPATSVQLFQYWDYWTWPCVSGEPYPPVAAVVGMSYSTYKQRPCILAGIAAGAGTITWPSVSSLGSDTTSSTFSGFTIRGWFAVTGTTGQQHILSYGVNALRITGYFAGGACEYWNGSAWVTLIAVVPYQSWFTFNIYVSPTGAVTYTVNGVTATVTVGVPAGPITVQLQIPNTGGVIAVSGLRVDYGQA